MVIFRYDPTCPAGELPCSYLLTVTPDGLAQYLSGPSLPPFDCPPLQEVMSQGHVLDGAVAKTKAQSDTMWRIREGVAEACGRRGASRGWGRGARQEGEGGNLVAGVQKVTEGVPPLRARHAQ